MDAHAPEAWDICRVGIADGHGRGPTLHGLLVFRSICVGLIQIIYRQSGI